MYFNSQMQQRKTRNTSYSNNMESLTFQVDGPINGRAYIHGGLITGIFFFYLQVDGPITREAYKRGGGLRYMI